jgi:hypothetical protein
MYILIFYNRTVQCLSNDGHISITLVRMFSNMFPNVQLLSTVNLEIFLFTTAPSLLSSGYQRLSLGVKRPKPEADHSPPSSAEVNECVELHSTYPIHLHGVVLS